MLQYDTSKMKLPCDELQPRNPLVNNYVMSKYMSEMITAQHRDEFNIIDVRISNVYAYTLLIRTSIILNSSLCCAVIISDIYLLIT